MELHEILIYGVAALGCFILAILIKGNRQAVLQLATDLINKAESTIQGSGMGADKKALIVTADPDEKVVRASNNIQNVKTTFVGSLNVVDILNCDKFIISQDAVKRVEEVYAE